MKHVAAIVLAVAFAAPVMAQRGVRLFVDAEGVRTSNRVMFEPNTVSYEPRFASGGGLGGGVNWFFTDRVSLEVKAAAMKSRLHLRRSSSDFVAVADFGVAQIYPITALLQWHMLEGTAIRPYIGAGAGHIILRDINRQTFGVSGVHFEDPTGLVVDGGVEVSLSKRFSIYGDARYTPIETRSRVTFAGTASTTRIDERPLVVSTGIAFRF